MSMINKVFLQRSLRGAQAKKQVKARTADVQRRAAAVRQQELAESRRLVATMRQDRERARMEAKRRKEARNGGLTTRSRLSRSAPLLPSASNTRSAPVPRLPLAKLTTSAAMSARGKVTVMPADAKTLRTPTNLWKAVNEQVAREARRDAMLEKQRKQALAKQWQHDLAVQMEEQRRAREARMAYDAAYAEIEKRQLQRSAVKEAREQAVLKAKMDKETRDRMEQVQAARQRREREVQRQERERRRNNQLMAEQEAKRAAEEKRKLKENRKWLAQVARTNQENMKAAHKKMLAELAQERGLSKVWQAQLDAQDKRRKEEFEAIYARGDKSAAFGAMLNIDPEAKAREDEARAEKWQRVQIAREERKARQKEERARRLVQDQQRALKAQMEHEAQLRRKALAEEMELQKTLIAMDKKAVADKEQEYAEKRRRNMEYRREIERQRAFDRRRAKNGKAPGAMPTEEVLMNRHRVKVAVINAAAQPASKRTQHRRGKAGSLRRSGGLSRAGSSALA